MNKLPGALVAIDVSREVNALREARSLGIPTVCLIDTDGDPDLADIPIPGNDDSMRSIDVIMRELASAVQEGKSGRRAQSEGRDDETSGGDDKQQQRRRSSRSQFRSERSASADAPPPPVAETPPSTDSPSAAAPVASTTEGE